MSVDKLKEAARRHEARREWKKAIEVYLQAIREFETGRDPHPDLSLYNRVGDLFRDQLNDNNSAVEQYDRAADLYAEQGLLTNAIALCGKILRTTPDRSTTYLKLAGYHMRKDVHVEAKRNLLEYLARMERAGRVDDAMKQVKGFAEQFAGNAEVRQFVTEILQKAGRPDDLAAHEASAGPVGGATAESPVEGPRKDAGGLVFLSFDEPEAEAPPPPVRPALTLERPAVATGERPAVTAERTAPITAESVAPPVETPLELVAPPVLDEPVTAENPVVAEPPALDLVLDGLEPTSDAPADESDTVAPLDGLLLDTFEPAALDVPSFVDEPVAAAPVDDADAGIVPLEGLEPTAFEPLSLGDDEALAALDHLPLIDAEEPPALTPELPTQDEPRVSHEFRVTTLEESADAVRAEMPALAEVTPLDDLPRVLTSEREAVPPLVDDAPLASLADAPDAAPAASDEAEAAPVMELVSPPAPPAWEPPPFEPPATITPITGETEVPPRVTQDGPVRRVTSEFMGFTFDEPGTGVNLDPSASLLPEDQRDESFLPEADPVALLEEQIIDEPENPALHFELAELVLARGEDVRAADEFRLAAALFADRGDAGGRARAEGRLWALRPEEAPPPPSAPVAPTTAERGAITPEKPWTPFGAPATPAPAAPVAAAPAASAPPPPADAGGSFVDLGSMILEEEGPRDTRMRVEGLEGDDVRKKDEGEVFRSMLDAFKKGVDANIDSEDFQAHYDLGIAYKEMGLLEEAIAEFQKALRAPEGRLRTSEALGVSFYEMGKYGIAESVLRRAVEQLPGGDEEKIGLLYWAGRALEAEARHAEAREYYERALAVDIKFMDVSERIQRLASR
ncbi:MAG: hypothetical protein NW201_15335 [Gemmatimonadales bacterium]|nr:hypothetical protein [Gemmatimonadales bacterium]